MRQVQRRQVFWGVVGGLVGLFTSVGCATLTEEEAPPPSITEPVAVIVDEPIESVESEEVVELPADPIEVPTPVEPGTPLPRFGDEIVVAGRFFRTGTPVVLWLDEGGYDGYRVERRYGTRAEASWERSREAVPALSSPNRYSARSGGLSPRQQEEIRGGNWSLSQLQAVVDQLVLHYDASGTSRLCFERLHDHRGLSIHFMIDVDGTIYQSLDLKEKAWHATKANSRSIGIEIANIGAYAAPDAAPLARWYGLDAEGRTVITIPANAHPESVRMPDYSGRPVRDDIVSGPINGAEFWQYDLTGEQYDALIKLTATLGVVFPNLAMDVPRDAQGAVRQDTLTDSEWRSFQGVIGHSHIQSNKIDPGPALQWNRIINEARALRGMAAVPAVNLPISPSSPDGEE